jgi:hypothetical protein
VFISALVLLQSAPTSCGVFCFGAAASRIALFSLGNFAVFTSCRQVRTHAHNLLMVLGLPSLCRCLRSCSGCATPTLCPCCCPCSESPRTQRCPAELPTRLLSSRKPFTPRFSLPLVCLRAGLRCARSSNACWASWVTQSTRDPLAAALQALALAQVPLLRALEPLPVRVLAPRCPLRRCQQGPCCLRPARALATSIRSRYAPNCSFIIQFRCVFSPQVVGAVMATAGAVFGGGGGAGGASGVQR